MKVYLTNLNESWIVDRLRDEWYQHNASISVDSIKQAEIIWIIAPWLWKKIKKKHLRDKKVVCSIYHLEDKDFKHKQVQDFKKRDCFVDVYHVISLKTKKELEKLTDKEIIYIPFWSDQLSWYEIEDKDSLRKKYNLPLDAYILGSFQRDTEGSDLKSPKLIKGPDRLVKIVEAKNKDSDKLVVLLSGKRRQYMIKELENLNINYKYFEMVDTKELNELYNCLDLYVVASRIEGGPQAIIECGLSKTPIISTDVGVASEFLHSISLFDMDNFQEAIPNTEYAFKKSKSYAIPEGFKEYIEMFNSIKVNNIF
jgi:glycosyltransferase involved in cell wall biosynthesis